MVRDAPRQRARIPDSVRPCCGESAPALDWVDSSWHYQGNGEKRTVPRLGAVPQKHLDTLRKGIEITGGDV